MAAEPERVRVEQVDWQSLLPFVRLFRSFRMAIFPPTKLLLALLMVVLLWLGGMTLDAIVGPRVYPNEIARYAAMSSHQFDAWLEDQQAQTRRKLLNALVGIPVSGDDRKALAESSSRFRDARDHINKHFDQQLSQANEKLSAASTEHEQQRLENQITDLNTRRQRRLAGLRALEPDGVFATALNFKINAFDRMVSAATYLNFGFGELLAEQEARPDTVVGALRDLVVVLPGWLYRTHPWFLVVWCVYAMALWSLFGGAIARLAARHATREEHLSAAEALRFSFHRWHWFFTSPLLPLLVVLVLGALMAVFGLVFFNVELLDIIGGMLFGLALLFGAVIAILLVGLAAGAAMLYPAIAVEGTDAFDANSRAYNYVLGRPWQWLLYTLVSLVYGAITYLFVGVVVFLSLSVTQYFVGVWVFRDAGGASRFDAMLPPPRLGNLAHDVDWQALNIFGKATAGLVSIWVYLFIGLLAAFAISYYLCSQTWVYLLLRRAADGTDYEDVFVDDRSTGASDTTAPSAAPEEVESPAETPEPDPDSAPQ